MILLICLMLSILFTFPFLFIVFLFDGNTLRKREECNQEASYCMYHFYLPLPAFLCFLLHLFLRRFIGGSREFPKYRKERRVFVWGKERGRLSKSQSSPRPLDILLRFLVAAFSRRSVLQKGNAIGCQIFLLVRFLM